MKSTLIIMAAGMASRYGSLKQIEKLGPQGQTIMDYSVIDAVRAGFGSVLFVIRRSMEADFKETILAKYKETVEVDYVFQEIDSLPANTYFNKERVKPWGTGHAILMAAHKVKGSFAVINADDFYGREAFDAAIRHIESKSGVYGIIGYPLNKTLSDHGAITRAVCEVDESNRLLDITERSKIQVIDGLTCYEDEAGLWQRIDEETTVSMNFWVFEPSFFKLLEDELLIFLQECANDLKSEFLIPTIVKELVKRNLISVDVYNVNSLWFGVTYPKDKVGVMTSLKSLHGY